MKKEEFLQERGRLGLFGSLGFFALLLRLPFPDTELAVEEAVDVVLALTIFRGSFKLGNLLTKPPRAYQKSNNDTKNVWQVKRLSSF